MFARRRVTTASLSEFRLGGSTYLASACRRRRSRCISERNALVPTSLAVVPLATDRATGWCVHVPAAVAEGEPRCAAHGEREFKGQSTEKSSRLEVDLGQRTRPLESEPDVAEAHQVVDQAPGTPSLERNPLSGPQVPGPPFRGHEDQWGAQEEVSGSGRSVYPSARSLDLPGNRTRSC
jgi:hypothetical protein